MKSANMLMVAFIGLMSLVSHAQTLERDAFVASYAERISLGAKLRERLTAGEQMKYLEDMRNLARHIASSHLPPKLEFYSPQHAEQAQRRETVVIEYKNDELNLLQMQYHFALMKLHSAASLRRGAVFSENVAAVRRGIDQLAEGMQETMIQQLGQVIPHDEIRAHCASVVGRWKARADDCTTFSFKFPVSDEQIHAFQQEFNMRLIESLPRAKLRLNQQVNGTEIQERQFLADERKTILREVTDTATKFFSNQSMDVELSQCNPDTIVPGFNTLEQHYLKALERAKSEKGEVAMAQPSKLANIDTSVTTTTSTTIAPPLLVLPPSATSAASKEPSDGNRRLFLTLSGVIAVLTLAAAAVYLKKMRVSKHK